MSMDPKRWINTIPFIGAKSNQEKYKLDFKRWVNTLPSKEDNTLILKDENALILSNAFRPNAKSNSVKKYFLTIIVFVVGLILVPVIKNETRNLQKEISDLRDSVNNLKFGLYQANLDHEVITSPENISLLAKEHLEFDFNYYKKSQIKNLNQKEKVLATLENIKSKTIFVNKKKNKEIKNIAESLIVKKIEIKATELKKNQSLLFKPKNLPSEFKLKVKNKIDEQKKELKNFYSDPYKLIKSKKAQKWVGLQVVKVFLGIPIMPGK